MTAITDTEVRPPRTETQQSTRNHAIVAEGLRKDFPGGVTAVAGVDLEIQEGEIFGFLGPNGAGKTTTVRMLTTLLRPDAGRATVAGFDLYRQAHYIRRSIGVALQEAGLDAMATGRELLTLQGRLFGIGRRAAADRAAELLDLLGLNAAADRRTGTYSGGMKRRLDLASALVHGPRLLFLDEPTEGLDPASRRAVWQEIRRLNREFGLTVFLTTHYLEEADNLAGRLAIIDQGRIVAAGAPRALKATIGESVVSVKLDHEQIAAAEAALRRLPGLRDVRSDRTGLTLYLESGAGSVADIVRVLDLEGMPMESVAISDPTLDDVFLQATGARLEGAAQLETKGS